LTSLEAILENGVTNLKATSANTAAIIQVARAL